jgi:hypothetical protein
MRDANAQVLQRVVPQVDVVQLPRVLQVRGASKACIGRQRASRTRHRVCVCSGLKCGVVPWGCVLDNGAIKAPADQGRGEGGAHASRNAPSGGASGGGRAGSRAAVAASQALWQVRRRHTRRCGGGHGAAGACQGTLSSFLTNILHPNRLHLKWLASVACRAPPLHISSLRYRPPRTAPGK